MTGSNGKGSSGCLAWRRAVNTPRFLPIVLGVGLALAIASCGGPTTKQVAEGQVELRGAGATFPAPLYKQWIEEFGKAHADIVVSYDAVGSGEGERRFLAGEVDFGASDAALTDAQIAQVARGALLIPTTAGSVVIAYNVEGLGGPLRLKRDVYADVFFGKIKRWDDPRIADLNPGLKLPSTS